MPDIKKKIMHRIRRHRRVRAKIRGTSDRPRLSVFRSNRHISVQLIDDAAGRTVVSAGDMAWRGGKKAKSGLAASAGVGALIAERAKEAGISRAVFDRGGYRYHGIVRAVAEGARKGGLGI